MTFNTYKYRLEFKDAQDRTHLVDIFPDNWAGAQTAVDGAENPLIYNFGQDGDSIFRAINPTDIEINLVVSDSTIYDDIKGSEEGTWGVTWQISASEVWRGYILPDQMTMPFDPPAAFTLRAICGLTLLKDEHWSPASEARQDIIVGIADALGEISGTSYQITAAADWHASGGSGNSYAEYEFDPTIFKDTEQRRPTLVENWAKTGTVLADLVGRFAGKLFMAGGRWRLIQREEVTGSTYQTDIYDTSGVDTATNESISRVTVAQGTELIEAQYTADRKYKDAEVFYAYGDLGKGLFANRSFEHWTGSALDNWTEHDEEGAGGDAPDSGSIYSKVTTAYEATPVVDGNRGGGRTASTSYAVKVGVVDNSSNGTQWAASKALVGIRQDATNTVTASQSCVVRFWAHLVATASSVAVVRDPPFYVGLWLDDGAGTEYYFDGNPYSATADTWVAGTMATPPEASKIALYNPGFQRAVHTGIDAHLDGSVTFPAAGTLRIILYNVVDVGGAITPTGIIYDRLGVEIYGGDDSERGTTRGHSVADGATYGATLNLGTFFTGEGPTTSHPSSLTRNGGTYAQTWVSSGGSESGYTLSKLHAERCIKAMGLERLQMTFQKASGTYWPHQGMYFDSTEYTCQSLSYEARGDVYTGEWVATTLDAGSVTTDDTTLNGYLLPHDVSEPFGLLGGNNETPDKPGGGGVGGGPGEVPILQRIGTTVVASQANSLSQAIAALSTTGGTVRISEGTYALPAAGSLAATSNITIEGDGWGTIIDVNTGDDAYGFYLNKAGAGSRAAPSISNVTLKNLTLQGRNDTLYFHEHTHLLNLNGASDVLIENVQFKNWRGDAIYLGSGNIGYKAFTFDHTTDTFTSNAHGFSDGDEVVVWGTSGEYMNDSGASGDEDLPDDGASGHFKSKTAYVVTNKAANTFQLALPASPTTAITSATNNGSGTFYVGTERHNERITIRNCHFDGGATDKADASTSGTPVNNRNAISVIDGSQIIIDGNYFTNCGASDMPGPIDIEPDRAPYHTIKGIRITNNQIEDCGGNIGAISCNLQRWGDYYNEPSDILIQGNTIDTCDATGILVQKSQKDVGGQTVDSVQAGADTVTVDAGHGYINTTPVWFKGTTVPNGLTEGRAYYVRDRTSTTFKVALTPGGSVVGLSATTPSCTVHDAPGERSVRQNIRIINNRVTQATGETTAQRGAPFALNGTNGAVVTGNQFSYCKGAAFVGYVRTMATRIADNSFFQVGTSEGAADLGNGALQIIDASILHVTNNEFTDCGESDDTNGEAIWWNGGNVEDAVVTGNIITSVSRTHNVSISTADFSRGTHIWESNVARNMSGTTPSILTTFATQFRTFGDGDTTPSVLGRKYFATANTGGTTVTDFDDGYLGQKIYVRIDSNTTLQHGTLRHSSGSDITGDANHIVCYVLVSGGVWIQTGIDA